MEGKTTTSGNKKGLLGLSTENGKAVPLKSVSVTVEVQGHLALVNSTLTYSHEEKRPVESVFTFPVDASSAVFKFTADVAGRRIVAKIQEKEQAEVSYDEAVESGFMAALLHQTDASADVFKCTLGSLPPKTEAKLTIGYAVKLPIEPDGRIRFTLPTVLNPRYSKGGQVKTGTVSNIPPCKVPYTFKMDARVKSTVKIGAVTSDRLKLDVKLSENLFGAEIVLAEQFQFDHDLTFLIQYDKPFHPLVVFEKGDPEAWNPYLKTDMLMLNFYPELKNVSMATSGEYIFVIDCSGSMEGEKIEVAKVALLMFMKSLPTRCYFNIICFGSKHQMLFKSSKSYTEKSLNEALKFQKKMKADMDGKDLLKPLITIYKNKPIQGHQRNIFVLTDGNVSNTNQLIKLVKENNNTTRVFSLGIGDDVSTTYLHNEMVRAGNGIAEFVTKSSKITSKVISLLKSSMQPCVSKVTVDWDLPPDVSPELIPSHPPSVIFPGERLTLFALLKGVNPDAVYAPSKVILKGECQQQPVTFDLSFTLSDEMDKSDQSSAPVHRLACKIMITEFEETYNSMIRLQESGVKSKSRKDMQYLQDIRQQMIDISRHGNVISKLTAFVAVDKEGTRVDSKMVERPGPVPALSHHLIAILLKQSLSCDGLLDVCEQNRSCGGQSGESERSRPFNGLMKGGGPPPPAEKSSWGFFNKNKDTSVESGACAALLGDEDEEDTAAATIDTMMSVVYLQEFSGHWKSSQQLLELLDVTDKMKSAGQIKDSSVLSTLAVVYWLRSRCRYRQDEWQLIEAKAIMWLEAQADVQADGVEQMLGNVATLGLCTA